MDNATDSDSGNGGAHRAPDSFIAWLDSGLRRLRPGCVRAGRLGLVGTKISRIHAGLNEVLRRHRRSCQAAQQRELSCVTHCVSEWALQESFFGCVPQFRSIRKVPGQILDHPVEPRDFRCEVGQRLRLVMSTLKVSARMAQNVGHVPNKVGRRSYLLASLERPEGLGCISQCFLRAIGKCG